MGAVKLLIVGAGGHGRDVAATARALGIPYRFCDDNPDLWMLPPALWDGEYTIGIGDPLIREKMADRFAAWTPATLVDPRAIVEPDCAVGEGAVIGAGSILLGETVIGRHVHLTYGVIATRATFGDFCTVGPGVTFCGYATIGPRAYVGAGSVIKNKITIGADAVIGCGSVVVRDVPEGVTVKGNPAK